MIFVLRRDDNLLVCCFDIDRGRFDCVLETPSQGFYGAATLKRAAHRYMSNGYDSPGFYQARSVARTSDNGGRKERLPFRKYVGAFLKARLQRALAFQRWAHRDAERLQEIQAREIRDGWIASELEAIKYCEGNPRAKIGSAWSNRNGLFERFRSREVDSDPIYRFTGKRANYFKRVVGRLVYVIVTDLPVVAAVPKISNAYFNVSRGMCPCGQHVLSYGICNNFWTRVGAHNLAYLQDLSVYSRVNNDYSEEIWMKWVDCAREYNFKADRGRKLIAETARKTISRWIPGSTLFQSALGIASDAYYVVTGHSPSVNSYRKAVDEYLITRSTVHPVDEVAEFLTVLGVNFYEDDAFTWARNVCSRGDLAATFAKFVGVLDDDLWMYISYANQNRGTLTLHYNILPFICFLEKVQDCCTRKLFKSREFYDGYFHAHSLSVRCSACHRVLRRCQCLPSRFD